LGLRRRAVPGKAALLTAAIVAVVAVPAGAASKKTTDKSGGDVAGEVYTLTNGTSRNAVLAFDRLASGQLEFHAAFPTGGRGGTNFERGCTTQCPFIDAQNELILAPGGHYLFAANPGSNTVSSFAVTSRGLKLVDQKSSGGAHPVSLTVHGDLLYVLNDGSLTISGLRVSSKGRLTPIKGSTQKLSTGAVTSDLPPRQIEFDNSGTVLAVTLLAVPVIDTFKVVASGVVGKAIVNRTAHPLPSAFSVDGHDRLAVAEIVNATIPPSPSAFPPMSVVSTYSLNLTTGRLTHIDSAADHGFAASWTAITNNGRHEYVVNEGAGAPTGATVSVMNIRASGHVSLAQVSPPGAPGPVPTGQELARTDDALTGDNKYLYVLVPGLLAPASKIDEFKVLPSGHIVQLGTSPTIPYAGVSGLAAS
jgi:6-phosphogluconolactonase